MKSSLKRLGVALALLGFSSAALACPCGCGAVGPLQLWPGETWKLQLQASREYSDGFVDGAGQRGPNGGAAVSDSLQLGVARALSDWWSFSVAAGAKRDWQHQAGSETGIGDPSIGTRYTVVQNDYEKPWIPQLQAFATYKYALDNFGDGESKVRQLEAESFSASEFVPGLDLWFYGGEWVAGLGEALLYRRDVLIASAGQVAALRETGLGHRTTVSLGYTYLGWGQLMAALEREAKLQDRLAGSDLANSTRLQHTLSLTGNLRIGDRKTLSINAKGIGKLLANRNGKEARSFGVSYIQAL